MVGGGLALGYEVRLWWGETDGREGGREGGTRRRRRRSTPSTSCAVSRYRPSTHRPTATPTSQRRPGAAAVAHGPQHTNERARGGVRAVHSFYRDPRKIGREPPPPTDDGEEPRRGTGRERGGSSQLRRVRTYTRRHRTHAAGEQMVDGCAGCAALGGLPACKQASCERTARRRRVRACVRGGGAARGGREGRREGEGASGWPVRVERRRSRGGGVHGGVRWGSCGEDGGR